MGTKAVFAVQTKPGYHCTTIIGMCMDGFPDNLKYLSYQFEEKMNRLRVKTLVKKGNVDAIKKVLDAVVEVHPDWLFTDNVKNASWVSHSAIYCPKTSVIEVYQGNLEYLTQKVLIKPTNEKMKPAGIPPVAQP